MSKPKMITICAPDMDDITIHIQDFMYFAVRKRFARRIRLDVGELSEFYKNPTAAALNKVTRGYTLFSQNAIDEDAALEELYDAKDDKTRARAKKLLAAINTRSTIYTPPEVLAFAYSAVDKYPELIPDVEKPLLIERAFNFIRGHYVHIMAAPESPPIISLSKGDEDFSQQRILSKWFNTVDSAAAIATAQYYATGDEKFIAQMESWPMFAGHSVLEVIRTPETVSKNKLECEFIDVLTAGSVLTSDCRYAQLWKRLRDCPDAWTLLEGPADEDCEDSCEL